MHSEKSEPSDASNTRLTRTIQAVDVFHAKPMSSIPYGSAGRKTSALPWRRYINTRGSGSIVERRSSSASLVKCLPLWLALCGMPMRCPCATANPIAGCHNQGLQSLVWQSLFTNRIPPAKGRHLIGWPHFSCLSPPLLFFWPLDPFSGQGTLTECSAS